MMVLFSNDYTKAQGNIILTGKVLDEKSNDPLGFTSIGVVGKPIGTITNSNGEFDFYINDKYSLKFVVMHGSYSQ